MVMAVELALLLAGLHGRALRLALRAELVVDRAAGDLRRVRRRRLHLLLLPLRREGAVPHGLGALAARLALGRPEVAEATGDVGHLDSLHLRRGARRLLRLGLGLELALLRREAWGLDG